MYEYPVLFPPMSNRESFVSTIQIADDQTGDLITLTDTLNNPLYAIFLEISPPRHHGRYGGQYSSPYYYDNWTGEPRILATLSNYLSIPDTGTIQVQIPYTVIQTLRGGLTYDVYLRMESVGGDWNGDFNSDFPADPIDARQLLIGKLPIHFGGHGT